MSRRFALLAAALTLGSCNGGESTTGLEDAPPVIASYAALVEASYADSVTTAETLRDALEAFVQAPSEITLTAARQAWIDARLPYRQTEGFRFYGGPIDDPADEREGQLNAWPLNEVTIDYVTTEATSGFINDTEGFPTVTAETILAANFQNGETDVKTGYHAIEFLLWGQDLDPDGAGARPFTDYVSEGTAMNQTRRGEYLLAVADLLVDDLTHVRGRWAAGDGTYRADFVSQTPAEALRRILTGIGTLAASELSGERMLTAYQNKDQEDEHSCFSDTTREDLIGNARSIENVFHGRYGSLDGPGLLDLIAARDTALEARVRTELAAMMAAVEAIPGPFDKAILGEDTDDGRTKVLAAVRAIQTVGDTIVDCAELLGVDINTAI
jgi:putative iron-regulated protein